ncbi:MAG: HD domain-containing phosphohydrolase [Mobilicoccus sp.]|nr:HD domain-containing phosphohydrolase [Mobilicoccus sp.]
MAVVVLSVATVALGWVGQGMRPFTLTDFPPFTVLLVAAAFSAGLRFGRGGEQVSFSFTTVVLLAAIPIVGPVGAVLLGIGSALLDARQGWWAAWVFNGMMFAVSAAVASLVYGATGGTFTLGAMSGADLVMRIGVPLLLADLAFCLTNLFIVLLVSLAEPGGRRRAVVKGVIGTLPFYLAWAIVAFVLVTLWGPAGVGPISVLLVLVPLIVTRHVHELFAGERLVRGSVIKALARAGREDGAEAHGERVHRYALAIASDLGIRATPALEYAMRLHAVGMVRPCSLRGILEHDAKAQAQRDTTATSEILCLIDFLGETCEAVSHQCEWYDGTGGPEGLSGGDIPLGARILAVADAADVLVNSSEDVHPEAAAVEVLRGAAGTRFDPEIVEALARSVVRTDLRTRRSGPLRIRRARPSSLGVTTRARRSGASA